MATTLLLWQDKSGDEPESAGEKERPDASASAATPVAPERSKQGRKSGKQQASNAPKKPPQRGLGVAQLERLRVQELRRKMLTEAGFPFGPMGTVPPVKPPPPGMAREMPPYSLPFPSDGRTGGTCAFMSPRLALHSAHPATGAGFCGFPRVAAGMHRYSVAGCGRILALSEGLDEVFPSGQRFHNAVPLGNPESVKELPSNQNVLCCSDQCDTCNKRTRAQCSGQNYGVRQQQLPCGSCTDGGNFLKLGLWSSGAPHPERVGLDQETQKCSSGRSGDLAMIAEEGMMVGKNGEDVLMEYEFFPAAKKLGGISVEEDDGEMMMAMAELPSSVSVPPRLASSSRQDAPLDLSLTLSSYHYSC